MSRKINAFTFIPGLLAIVLLILRSTLKIWTAIDFDFLGKVNLTLSDFYSRCTSTLITNTDKCNNIQTVNTVFWILFGVLVVIQIYCLTKRSK